MTPTEIRTERLLLRAVEETDLEAFNKWFSDPEVMKYELFAAHTDIEQTEEFIDISITRPHNGVLEFSVCLPDLDAVASTTTSQSGSSRHGVDSHIPMAVIGRAAIRDGEEIEFMFNRQYWGKGYAFETASALLKHFWATHQDANVVKADVDPRNKRSLRLLEHLGFKKVGTAKKTFKTHMGWCDSVYLEIKRPVG